MRLNDAGRIVAEEGQQPAVIRAEIELDEWVVMPNHIHGIVIFNNPAAGAHGRAPLRDGAPQPAAPPTMRRQPRSLGSFIAGFKSAATKRINEFRATPGAPVWQCNYHEHIIRDERELVRIRRHIRNNPLKWALDPDHADNTRRLPPPGHINDYLADLEDATPPSQP